MQLIVKLYYKKRGKVINLYHYVMALLLVILRQIIVNDHSRMGEIEATFLMLVQTFCNLLSILNVMLKFQPKDISFQNRQIDDSENTMDAFDFVLICVEL